MATNSRLAGVIIAVLLLTLRGLAQGSLSTPEALQFDETTNEWHWTVMTGEGGYGYIGEYQRRAKASTTWPSTWTEFVNVGASDGTENVERRVSIPVADFDRDTYDYRIRIYYQINPDLESYDEGGYRISETLEGYEPSASSVSIRSSGSQLTCSWTEPSSGASSYELRTRSRVHGEAVWGSWSTTTTVAGSATRSLTLSTAIRHRLEDWQCGVTTVLGATKSSEATATRSGRPLGPPANLRIAAVPNTLIAEWLPIPAAENYEYRTRSRLRDTDVWGDWGAWLTTLETRESIESDPTVYNAYDWQVEARGRNLGILGASNIAAWIDGVTILPPPVATASESNYVPPLDEVTCETVTEDDNNIEVWATHGLASGIQCQVIGAAGIGIQSIIDGGFYAAVDVWSWVTQGAQVCFADRGSLIFLDANETPRIIHHIGHYIVDGKTCTWLTGPGSVILVPLRDGDQAPSPLLLDTVALSECMVTTTHRLRFRQSPGGPLLGNAIDIDVTLTATQRTDDWFHVDNMGVYGWISASYVTTQGNCG